MYKPIPIKKILFLKIPPTNCSAMLNVSGYVENDNATQTHLM